MLGPRVSYDLHPDADGLKTVTEPVDTLVWPIDPSGVEEWSKRVVTVHRLAEDLSSTYYVKQDIVLAGPAVAGVMLALTGGLEFAAACGLIWGGMTWGGAQLLGTMRRRESEQVHRELALRQSVLHPSSRQAIRESQTADGAR